MVSTGFLPPGQSLPFTDQECIEGVEQSGTQVESRSISRSGAWRIFAAVRWPAAVLEPYKVAGRRDGLTRSTICERGGLGHGRGHQLEGSSRGTKLSSECTVPGERRRSMSCYVASTARLSGSSGQS